MGRVHSALSGSIPTAQVGDVSRPKATGAIHFGAVCGSAGGEFISYGTLCGLEWDCGNRDPEATTCKVCLRARVLEHPKDSLAWEYFGLMPPPPSGGWIRADAHGGWTCCVDQGRYGHASNKRTWLYAVVPPSALPSLAWGKGEQRIPQWMIDRYGYEKARRIGVVRHDRRQGQNSQTQHDT